MDLIAQAPVSAAIWAGILICVIVWWQTIVK